jgi:hypothetical protein
LRCPGSEKLSQEAVKTPIAIKMKLAVDKCQTTIGSSSFSTLKLPIRADDQIVFSHNGNTSLNYIQMINSPTLIALASNPDVYVKISAITNL